MLFRIAVFFLATFCICSARPKDFTSIKVSPAAKAAAKQMLAPREIFQKIGYIADVDGKVAVVRITNQIPFGDGTTYFYSRAANGEISALLNYTNLSCRYMRAMDITQGTPEIGDFVFAKFVPDNLETKQ
ncbi:MAG: hypothetical protein SPI34_02970 [Opitutales bacterium]|nr:hypothetical protein [Opitutales bacterium]